MGPDPVTLSLKDLDPDSPTNISTGYVVTDKADGIRAELFIDSKKQGYLIKGKSMKVEDTGLTFENVTGAWVLDGEYITQDKQGSPIHTFMIFDVYYAEHGSEHQLYPDHVYTYPWSSLTKGEGATRSRILLDFKRALSGKIKPIHPHESQLQVGFKSYLEPGKLSKVKQKNPYNGLAQIMTRCQTILERDEGDLGYRTDGLILLPMHCPVKSMNESPVESIRGKWDRNFKWKPPAENTIDFKVKIVKAKNKNKWVDLITSTVINGVVHQCNQVELIVGYDEKDDPNYDYSWKILDHSRHKPMKKNKDQQRFSPDGTPTHYLTNIPLQHGKLLCERDQVELKDNMIIEMAYRPDLPEGSRWRPLRDRPDKDSPQYFTIAHNIWSTIMNPVTKNMITGQDMDVLQEMFSQSKDPCKDITQADDSYYKDDDKSSESDVDAPLRKFHNYIKSRLIQDVASSIKSKKISILDTSVGRGGDVHKYLTSGDISFFLGLDISPDVNKAAKRFYLEKMKKPKAMFIQYDTSQPLHTGEGLCVGVHSERNQHLIDILYKNKKVVPKEFRNIDSSYRGLGTKGFDLISSQFTLHYYFKDELTLRGYLQNLKDNCKGGGYFIGTCYDGERVFKLLKEKSADGWGAPNLEMNDEYWNKVFSISSEKLGDDFTYHKDNKESLFGRTIQVYMKSIGQTIDEYLVNFEMFIDMMDEYGFKPVGHSGIFNHQDYSNQKGLGSFGDLIKNFSTLSSQDKLLSKKYSAALALSKEENQPLRELSQLNNWFVFQKQS